MTEKKMKFGICQWNLPVDGPEGCYELVKLGLDGMELSFSEELIENLDEYRKSALETGVEFPSMGMNVFCGQSYITAGSESFFESEIQKALKCASYFDSKTIQIPAFFASDIKTEVELDMAAKNLKKACEMAEKYNIYIGTENALDAENNLKLFSMVNHPLFKFYFDNQNLWRMKGKKCESVLHTMKDQIIEVHAKDSLVNDGKQKWMPLGTGDAEFFSSMNFLKNIDYNGWILLENDYNLNFSNYDYESAIKKDLQVLKNIFKCLR